MRVALIVVLALGFGGLLFWAGRETAPASVATDDAVYDPVLLAKERIVECRDKLREHKSKLASDAILLRLPNPVTVTDESTGRALTLREVEERIGMIDIALIGLEQDATEVLARATVIDYGLVDVASRAEARARFERALENMAENADRVIAATRR